MKPENFIEAIRILTKNHSNRVIINHVKKFVDTNEHKPKLHITDCCASVIDELKDAGFALSMRNGMLSVDDYSKPLLEN